MSENLIIYYSRAGQNYVDGKICHLEKGNCELVAEYIQDAIGADLFRIETETEYPEDYMACTEVAKAELKKGARPQLKRYLEDISGYRRIIICGPCWWGTYPTAMFTQLERLDWKGKLVYPVITHEGSGVGTSAKDLKKMLKGAKIARTLAIPGSAVPTAQDQIAAWAKTLA